MSRHPEVKWAERLDKVYITVQLPDAKNVKVNLEPDGVFSFTGTAGTDGNTYEIKLDLHDKVNVEDSKINIGVRNIFCVVEKAEKAWWKKLLRGDVKTPHYVKVDWDKWVDEDDDNTDGADGLDMGGMDFSSLGGMGGMGGLGGMGGMGGLGGMGGMGGLGGMGGMGGMGGLGGMGGMGGLGGMSGMGMDDDLVDTDEEEQATGKTEDAGKAEEVSSEVKTETAPST